MRLIVLGAAAGGGLPQWNCGCRNCAAAREGRIPGQTQSSVAVSADGARWLVINASPDIRQQLTAQPALHPRGLRGSPVEAVLLTNGDVDHVAGLLVLREKTPFALYATAAIHRVLRENDIFGVLDPALVQRREIAPGTRFEPLPGLGVTLFPVPGKAPLYREGDAPELRVEGEGTVGVELRAGAARAFYIPGCAAMTAALAGRLRGAALVLFDGTVWRDDEMIAAGTGTKTGARMGHMAMDGPEGSIAAFAGIEVGQKVFVHINNTNPVLDPASAERRAAEAAGWTIGRDGMAFAL
jgi:pyrroloquinoline quinone biosynthesis protein B